MMTMLPEAVPIIDQGINHSPNLLFTNKLAIELRNDIDPRVLRKLGSLSKEVIGIVRINDEFNAKLPNSLSRFNRAVIILGSGVGESWFKYVMSLTNTIIGFTLDSLMRLTKIRPSLLNIPNELFIDPIISTNDAAVVPKALPKAVIDWLMDYVDSGGDLYVLVRGDSIGNNINLLMHSRLVFTYNVKLAELYNSIIKGGFMGGLKVDVRAGCDFCGSAPNPLCLLTCPNVDLVREVGVE